MNEPIRVLYVEAYPGFRGAQRSLATLASCWQRGAAVQATVRCTHEGRAAQGYRALGIPVEIHPAPKELREVGGGLTRRGLPGLLALLPRLLADSLRWFRRLRADPPDLVHCNQARGALLVGPAARALGLPLLWHQRGRLDLPPIARRLATALATDIVCVSNDVRECFPPSLRSRIRVVPNAFDSEHRPAPETVAARREWLEAEAARQGAGEAPIHLVTASSFLPYKGLHHLVDALGSLLEHRPDLRRRLVWTLLGDSESDPARERYRRELELRIENLTHAPVVLWAGWQQAPLPFLAAADLVLLPTVASETFRFRDGTRARAECSEGLPRTVLEALALGRAVIATDVAGVRDLIEHEESGWVVPPGDPGALERAIEELVDDPERRQRLGRAGARRAEGFAPGTMANTMTDLYREILERRWRR